MSCNEGEKKECQCHECHCHDQEHECHCHEHEHEHECHCHEHEHECHCHEHECHCHSCDDEEEEYSCDCCCCGPPPTLLNPLLKVEGASKVEVFTKGYISDTEEEASLGDHIKITFPPHSFTSASNFLVIGPLTKVRVTINNKGEVVYTKDYEIENCGDVIIEYQGDLEELLIDNLDESQPLKIGGFLLCGARSDICSIFQTGQSGYLQPLYHCKTCNFKEGQCICKGCADKCHAGHDMTLMTTVGFCDCPDICECKNKIPEDVECTYAENGPELVEQKMYICKTCGYTGKQRCCEACAKYCHSGHDVELAPETYGRCACGGQNAPGKPCLFVPPVDDCVTSCSYVKYGDKPVKQEMFSCETCHFQEGQMMCMACALVCHVTHKIIKLGEKEGVCACGKHEIKDSACHLTDDKRPRPMPLVGCPCCMGMH